MDNEQIIRDAIISHCPDAEVFDYAVRGYGDVNFEGTGLAPLATNKEPSETYKTQDSKYWHWWPRSEGLDMDKCISEVLDNIDKLRYVTNIKKLFIRDIEVSSGKEFTTCLTNNQVYARFSLVFD